jgi:hypothetical protein
MTQSIASVSPIVYIRYGKYTLALSICLESSVVMVKVKVDLAAWSELRSQARVIISARQSQLEVIMSLNLLPRGVAARRAIVRDDSMESPASDQPEQMQVDAAIPQSSSIELPQNQLPPRGQRAMRGQNQPPSLASAQQSKSNVYQRKAPKPIKPRELCVLIETAMSNYSLWTNADLRRYAADRNTNGCEYRSTSSILKLNLY